MIGKQIAIRDELKPVERRLKVLDKHLEQVGYYREFSKIYKLYKQQKPNRQADYYESHRRELTLFESANRYLKDHLYGRDKIPLAVWKAEREKLTGEKNRLYREYIVLKDETAAVEKIRSNVYDIMREEARVTQRAWTQDNEL